MNGRLKYIRYSVIVTLLLAAGTAFAQQPSVWPFPPLPSVPAGTNPAAYPMPRMDWFKRVSTNNENAKKAGDSIQLIFDGDSITDFWQGRGKAIWMERYGKYNAFNFGIASDRTEHLLWRLSQGQVDGLHPKLIVIMIGTNNVGANTPDQIAEGIKAVVAEYQKRCPYSTILLLGIFPRGESATNPPRIAVKAINDIICKLGDGKKVIYIDLSEKFLNPDGTLSPEIMPDFLHPSPKGYQIWADAIQPIIDKQLGGNKL